MSTNAESSGKRQWETPQLIIIKASQASTQSSHSGFGWGFDWSRFGKEYEPWKPDHNEDCFSS